jgi:hypothetical protein
MKVRAEAGNAGGTKLRAKRMPHKTRRDSRIET